MQPSSAFVNQPEPFRIVPTRTVTARPSPEANPSRRPLYLYASVKARVDMDGPALRVRATGRAEARYPLYRISRVIASPRVDWSAGALQACCESGIPIIIVARDGAPLGSFQPAGIRASLLCEDIDELLDRPDWREIYACWLRAARMRILADWREGREKAGEPLGEGEFKEMVRRHVYGASEAFKSEVAAVWRAALYAIAVGAVRSAGLQPLHWGAGGTALHLLDDLTRLLELRLRLEVRGAMELGLDGEAVALKVFHALSDKLLDQCERILGSLARRVKQVLSEWR